MRFYLLEPRTEFCSNFGPIFATVILTVTGSFLASGVDAQNLVDASDLQVSQIADCSQLLDDIKGRQSGGQWLIGNEFPLYSAPNAQQPLTSLGESTFEQVQCYNQAEGSGLDRVFIGTADGQSCGWVDRQLLLSENSLTTASAIDSRRVVCDVPRAMLFDNFCAQLEELGTTDESACEGVPPGLRAKGVLIGSSAVDDVSRFQFFSAAMGGEALATKTFFSVLEIHDVAEGDDNSIMVLVGDGEGDMFGWINLQGIELWPTRLGLFYDTAGIGSMYQRQRDLISNWRRGKPSADVESGLSTRELEGYVHGNLQLLTYPIVRTIQPASISGFNTDEPALHEVILLGQTGEGSASQLMSEAQSANRQDALRRLNLMIVLDTTESMRIYLPLVQDGITDFIESYQAQSSDTSNQLPDLRLAVYAYSDFQNGGQIALNDPIETSVLMPPTRIDADRDLTGILSRISNHEGLNDAVGLREEASLETIAQLSNEFGRGGAWFDDGPRVIIHMADHGSRSDAIVEQVLARLETNRTFYLPVAVVTEDETQSSTTARQAFERQARAMLAPLVDNPTSEDVRRVDLLNFEATTAIAVENQLNLVLDEVVGVLQTDRSRITGLERDESSRQAEDRLSSRIRLDDALREQFNLPEGSPQTIVQASSAFAPLQTISNGIVNDINWTYSIALEPSQASFLARNFAAMCSRVGSPEQSKAFKDLIVAVAATFSGDTITSDRQIRAILSDMSNLPGASRSFLSQPPQVLLDKADSTDPVIIEELRRDICWISYHMGNMQAGIYARPDQLSWSGREWRPSPGEEVIAREYRYKPLIGAETIYLPSFFFVLPSVVEEQGEVGAEDACIFC